MGLVQNLDCRLVLADRQRLPDVARRDGLGLIRADSGGRNILGGSENSLFLGLSDLLLEDLFLSHRLGRRLIVTLLDKFLGVSEHAGLLVGVLELDEIDQMNDLEDNEAEEERAEAAAMRLVGSVLVSRALMIFLLHLLPDFRGEGLEKLVVSLLSLFVLLFRHSDGFGDNDGLLGLGGKVDEGRLLLFKVVLHLHVHHSFEGIIHLLEHLVKVIVGSGVEG